MSLFKRREGKGKRKEKRKDKKQIAHEAVTHLKPLSCAPQVGLVKKRYRWVLAHIICSQPGTPLNRPGARLCQTLDLAGGDLSKLGGMSKREELMRATGPGPWIVSLTDFSMNVGFDWPDSESMLCREENRGRESDEEQEKTVGGPNTGRHTTQFWL